MIFCENVLRKHFGPDKKEHFVEKLYIGVEVRRTMSTSPAPKCVSECSLGRTVHNEQGLPFVNGVNS